MHWDKRKLLIGIVFLIIMVLCVVSWVKEGYNSINVSGTFLFLFIGIGFIRSAGSKG